MSVYTFGELISAYFTSIIQEKKAEIKKELGKYAVRPPKDLRSKYEMKMVKRAEDNRLAEIQKKKEEEEQKIAVRDNNHCDPSMFA